MNSSNLDADFWENRYRNQETGWDLGTVSPPLKDYIDQLENKDAAILIPGCGNAYEAEYLLNNGFTHVTLIDISPSLCEAISSKMSAFIGRSLTVICDDFFNCKGRYDLVLEQTFFCALDPSLRSRYVDKMHEILKPGGKLAGVLFNRSFEGGPPFGGDTEEYRNLFKNLFNIRLIEPCYNSVTPRLGSEVFVILENKP